MEKRRRYTAEDKVMVLREILEEGKAVSVVSSEHGIHPNVVLSWRKQLFEGALGVFSISRTDVKEKALGRKLGALEAKIRDKDNVIAELAQEVLEFKKKRTGLR